LPESKVAFAGVPPLFTDGLPPGVVLAITLSALALSR
jgi:hypothetical protein